MKLLTMIRGHARGGLCAMTAVCAMAVAVVGVLCTAARAQDAKQTPDAKQIVQRASNAELMADRNDTSHWRYLRHEAGGNVWVIVETENGAISRRVQVDGRPANATELAADDAAVVRFIRDPGLQEKQKRDGEADDKSATQLLKMLPDAFTWKMESETPETYVLSFAPNPNFDPPNMEGRVMGDMAGTMVVNKAGDRIQTMKGRLVKDVNIGFGLLARIKQGGTFDVERRLVAPGQWQITETRVHISGHALFFKTIGQQQDEEKTEFTQVPPGTTLQQAVGMLKQAGK